MWDLNDSPDWRRNKGGEESEGCSSLKTSIDGDDDKGKRVGSMSNSSSSAVVIEDGSEEEGEKMTNKNKSSLKKKSSKIFGFCVNPDESMDVDDSPVTRQFFPVEEEAAAVSSGGATTAFPRAHWVGVRFCQPEVAGAAGGGGGGGGGKPVEVSSQPMKKSRRGPRSRSSQYRGVTFYRRTGRWESHIWLVLVLFISMKCGTKIFVLYLFISHPIIIFGFIAGIVENRCIWVSKNIIYEYILTPLR